MSDPTIRILSAVIVALAHTWDSRLPGYRQQFSEDLGNIYMQTPVSDLEVRNALETIIQALG